MMRPRRGRPLIQLSGANVVWDGNSLVAGDGAFGQTAPLQLSQQPEFAGGTVVNRGVSGQSWAHMIGASDVDSAWQEGATNILLLWETVNSVFGYGRTSEQVLTTIAQYTSARRAVHPWMIACLGTIPCEGYNATTRSDVVERTRLNHVMSSVDAALQANPALYGLDVFVNLRGAGSPFGLADYTSESFSASGAVWAEAAGSRVHLNASGYGVVAQAVRGELKRCRRAPHN